MPPILVAPKAFHGTGSASSADDLRAPLVAAAIGRGLERAGLEPPDLCPLSEGGPGTIEVLLPALGGETADGFALVDDGATALCEDRAHLDDAAAGGAALIVYCGAEDPRPPDGPWTAAARLLVLTGPATPGAEWAAAGAQTVAGPTFVLGELGFDERMRAARAVVTGAGVLEVGALLRVVGEAATRARQAGVPAHAIVGHDELSLFDRRILDLQDVLEAPTLDALDAAGEALGERLRPRDGRRPDH